MTGHNEEVWLLCLGITNYDKDNDEPVKLAVFDMATQTLRSDIPDTPGIPAGITVAIKKRVLRKQLRPTVQRNSASIGHLKTASRNVIIVTFAKKGRSYLIDVENPTAWTIIDARPRLYEVTWRSAEE